MESTTFFLMVFADCEATQHTIRDADLGERAARGLVEITEKENLRMTFFGLPTDLESRPALYRDLIKAGHTMGLHLHPADLGYEEFFGIYGPDDQRKILIEAIDRFAQVMNYKPKGICIGYGSANDYTFPILADLGFVHCTLSIPTRVLPECASVWAGAPLDMHYAHPYNRILPGWLNLVNVPNTLDPDSRMWGGKHPQDLRVELVDAKNHWYTIHKAVERQLHNDTPVKYIQICTHNTFRFDDPNDFRHQTLVKMIQHAKNIITSKGGKVVAATQGQAADAFRSKFPLDKAKEFKLKLDTRGR